MLKKLIALGLIAVAPYIYHTYHEGTDVTSTINGETVAQIAIPVAQLAQQAVETAQEAAQNWIQSAGWLPTNGWLPSGTIETYVTPDGERIIEIHFGRHLGLHRLPSIAEPRSSQAGQVQIGAGDNGVSSSELRRATHIVQAVSLPVLNQRLGAAPAASTRVVLFSSPETYGKALIKAGLPTSEVQDVVTKTGGLTVGSDVWIPLYALHGTADLANVLTHELTHVVLNQKGIGDTLPTWINEGIAWYDGLTAESQVSPAQAVALARAYDRDIARVAHQQRLLPLSASEQQILRADYNVEWVDYLAVDQLIHRYGLDAFTQFLNHVRSDGVDGSFQAAFHIPRSTYEQVFIEQLEQS